MVVRLKNLSGLVTFFSFLQEIADSTILDHILFSGEKS